MYFVAECTTSARAEREGLLQHRRGEGVVDHGDDAAVARRAKYRGQVGDTEHGVGRRLEPAHVDAIQRIEHLLRVGHVNGADAESALPLQSLEERARAVVSRTGKQHSGSEWQRREQCRYRRESRGEGDAVAALEFSEGLFEGAPRGIAPTAVADVAAVAVGGGEGRRNVEGSAGGRRSAGDDSEGLGVPLLGSFITSVLRKPPRHRQSCATARRG